MKIINLSFILIMILTAGIGQTNATIHLWPGEVPGELLKKNDPVIATKREVNFTRITEVTDPALVVFPAGGKMNTGAAVIICPGGGYNILAIDLEGYEIAAWLNTLGINAFVLQYRVPKKRDGALQDVQRAVRIVRGRASEWKLNPGKIGVLGFSAGGSLSARAGTQYNEVTYKAVDEYDGFSCRPDFAVLIYPAYLDNGPGKSLTPELAITEKTPPMYIFGTADDSYGNSSLVMAAALRNAKVPVELHFMPTGGHGYGLRPGNIAGETWPGLLGNWLVRTVMK